MLDFSHRPKNHEQICVLIDTALARWDIKRSNSESVQTFFKAAISIAIADLSMSIDNVLLVASIARENPALLFVGMTFTVIVMGLAANYVAKLLQRYHWIAWVGLVVILYVAVKMIYDGWVDPEIGLGHLFGWVR